MFQCFNVSMFECLNVVDVGCSEAGLFFIFELYCYCTDFLSIYLFIFMLRKTVPVCINSSLEEKLWMLCWQAPFLLLLVLELFCSSVVKQSTEGCGLWSIDSSAVAFTAISPGFTVWIC